MKENDTYLIVGLGNPGPRYSETRHNIGFKILEELQKEMSFPSFLHEKKFEGEISQGRTGDKKVILLKPLTFMNESGRSVRALSDYFKIALENIVVVHDDVDLLPGKLKFKKGGGSGGHNGLKSLDRELSGNGYYRVRFGVGKGDYDTADWVLGKFSSEDRVAIQPQIPLAVEVVKGFLSGGVKMALDILSRKEGGRKPDSE